MRHNLPVIEIFGVSFARATTRDVLDAIAQLFDSHTPALIAYANANTMELSEKDRDLKSILQNAAMVLNDGVGVAIAAKLMCRQSFPANLNGTDLTPQILKMAAERQWRVFLLGAAPGVAEIAQSRLTEQIARLIVSGTHSGFFPASAVTSIVRQIRDAKTDLLLVAMGNPDQEKWLARYLVATGARIGIGVGAFFDFAAGTATRAPTWMRAIKLEWLFRLSREPKRLWRRYLVGGSHFLLRVARFSIAREH